ncbi:unnamed protein product, partial [Schistosoma curassoni]
MYFNIKNESNHSEKSINLTDSVKKGTEYFQDDIYSPPYAQVLCHCISVYICINQSILNKVPREMIFKFSTYENFFCFSNVNVKPVSFFFC